MNMKKFAALMSVLSIIILLGTCAVFVAAQRNLIQIDKSHIQSVVFCALGLAFLCFVPSKIVVLDEAKKQDKDPKGANAAEMALVVNIAAGLILVVLSVYKFFQ